MDRCHLCGIEHLGHSSRSTGYDQCIKTMAARIKAFKTITTITDEPVIWAFCPQCGNKRDDETDYICRTCRSLQD